MCWGNLYCCWSKVKEKKTTYISDSTKNDDSSNISYENDERVKNADQSLNPPVVVAKGYVVKSPIGGGGFSNVYSAENLKENDPKKRKIAVKLIKFDAVSKDWKDAQLKNEMKISKRVDHENIIKNIDVIKTSNRAFMFMERAKGPLETYIIKKYGSSKRVPEKDAKIFFKQIVAAVQYLHTKGAAHRGKSGMTRSRPITQLF